MDYRADYRAPVNMVVMHRDCLILASVCVVKQSSGVDLGAVTPHGPCLLCTLSGCGRVALSCIHSRCNICGQAQMCWNEQVSFMLQISPVHLT